MNTNIFVKKMSDELERLVKASKEGDFNVVLNADGLSGMEAEFICLLNEVVGNYCAAVKSDLLKNNTRNFRRMDIADVSDDLKEQTRLALALEYRKRMLNALNKMAVILISHKKETFDVVMSNGLKPVASVAGIDRVAVYRRLGRETQLGQIYLWYGETIPLEKELIELPEIPPIFRWLETLRKGNCINSNVEEMQNDEAAFLRLFGVKSIFFVPIFVREEFWGVITLEDHTNYRYFEEDNLDLLRSAAHLCAGAVVRAEMEREVEVASEKLKDALNQATSASRAKSDFLSGMSHEMRTPLNAIIGMTSIGKNSKDIEQKDYALSKIEDASSHLLGLINDVLDMAKIEADKLELAPVEYYFERMLQKVVAVISFRINEKRQRLSVHIDGDIPRMVIGDDQRLAQVLTNLLSNAVKFTPKEGEIRLSAYLKNEKDGVCELRIEVSDNGIGISGEQQKKLFRAFEQAESGISRKYGGTGLGLIISKRIVELMDGNIWIESKLGEGARFIFTLKVKRGNKNPRSLLAPGVNWENVRILAVDDMPETRSQFRNLFSQFAITCDVADNGFEACRLIEERGAYDIYFIDWRMPGMDGIELTRKIKSIEKSKPSVAIIITAADWEQIKNELSDAGVDKCLLKPLFSSMIIDCVNECLGVIPDTGEDVKHTADEFRGKRMLLAEDIEINREILISILEDTGILIDCAVNGKEALDMIEAAPDKYDIVLMDMQMPLMDGLEATRRIRAVEADTRHVPIIALTANVFKSDIEECIAAGMDDHLGKPLDMDSVYSKLRKYLKIL